MSKPAAASFAKRAGRTREAKENKSIRPAFLFAADNSTALY
jgi:hypothetical protein